MGLSYREEEDMSSQAEPENEKSDKTVPVLLVIAFALVAIGFLIMTKPDNPGKVTGSSTAQHQKQ
jgi:hypothetical protein